VVDLKARLTKKTIIYLSYFFTFIYFPFPSLPFSFPLPPLTPPFLKSPGKDYYYAGKREERLLRRVERTGSGN
jgi:hypothetical protein